MSQERLEIVRTAYAAWNRGDSEACLRDAHPDVAFVQDSRIPGAVTLSGRAAMRAWLEGFRETWESFQISPERIEAVGDRVLVVATISARGRLSEAHVERRVAHVLTFQAKQISRWESYSEPGEALDAMGLSE